MQSYKSNPTRQKENLKLCRNYLKSVPSSVSNETSFDSPVLAEKFPQLPRARKHKLDLAAALACYAGGQPFTVYQNNYMKSFLHSLNPAYKPPSRQALAEHLLDEVYTEIKARTDTVISSIEHINISTDESTNINANRICNISIHSKYSALHYVVGGILVVRLVRYVTFPANSSRILQDTKVIARNERY